MAKPDVEIPSEMLAVQVVKVKRICHCERGTYSTDLYPVCITPAINKIPTPSPAKLGPHDMLLRTAVASLCHTDLMVLDGVFHTPLPITMSLEGTAVVVATGASVTNFKIGDRVMSGIPLHQRGRCEHCNPPDGKDWDQTTNGATVIITDEAFAEFHVVDALTSCHVPDDVSFITAAPLPCAGVTVYRAVLVSEVKEGGWLAIVGAGGGLGHFGVQFAKARDINVIARAMGAHHVLDAREGKAAIVEKVKALTNVNGVEVTVNVSDHPSTAALSAAMTRMHGTVVQAAQPEEIIVPFQDVVLRDVTIKGTMLGGRDLSQEMLDFVVRHHIKDSSFLWP
ncbi:uncharacterized protein Z518_09676 [Rhinocladiella mackenziei CBS 650.93]|uniref:Enoyl reductase (ER) domain-containing protein n=1 Tax=Rhinocladiella mackenziei CBS 650.93 TaxID=1442369 RepID=A0A0D2IBE6_9EURO|nr:uncharacterized protein Z518_09676 [Rhinocladiella mackenziei CBS 650.93]KIX00611.1 hypothetical protein Z518_09676 [Rhinocladiella mackenziei CBS 650.93]